MGKLILKVGGRGEKASAIYQFDESARRDDGITIGRAYNNDVIVDDAFVSPQQFRLTTQRENINLETLERVNPIFINRRLSKLASTTIAADSVISVGRTQIRILTENSRIAPTRQQFASSWSRAGKISPFVALLALVAYALSEAFAGYFQTSTDLEWREPVYMTLFAAAMLFVWAGLWALAGRLLKHQSLFFVQLFLTSIVCVAFVFISPISEFIDFNANETLPGEVASYLTGFLFFAALLKVNLMVATNLQNSTWAAALSSLFLFGIGFATVHYYQGEFTQEQIYPMSIKPPFAVMRTPITIEEYFDELRKIEHEDIE